MKERILSDAVREMKTESPIEEEEEQESKVRLWRVRDNADGTEA